VIGSQDEDSEMTHYRAYFIGRDGHFMKAVDFIGRDGHFMKAVDIVCDDDDAAKKQAQRMADGFDVELWQQHRRVEKFEGLPAM
jgi:hypothetical protein